jgi:hypothetical protein
MATLTTAARRRIPAKEFVGPRETYPIEDEVHARNALSRVSAYGSPAQKARVRAAVKRKYPDIKLPKKRGGKAHGRRPAARADKPRRGR